MSSLEHYEGHKKTEAEPVVVVGVIRVVILFVISVFGLFGIMVDPEIFDPVLENLELVLAAIVLVGGLEQFLTGRWLRDKVWAPATVEDQGWLDPPENLSTEEPDDSL